MQREHFVVKYITANNCFVHLSTAWLRRLETKENAIQISHNEKIYFFSCIPRISNSKSLCIGATFARSLNIQEGDEVFVSSVKNTPTLTSINVVPCTTNDRELLELQMEKIQMNLLNQVRIVAKGQPIVAWISKFSSAAFIVDNTEPQLTYGLLEQFTEVHVLDAAPNATIRNADINEDDTKMNSSLAKVLPYLFKRKNQHNPKDSAMNYALLQSFRKKCAPRIFRVHPLPSFQFFDPSNLHDVILLCPYHILIPRKHMLQGKVSKVSENRQHATSTTFLRNGDSSQSSTPPQELTARIYILEDVLEKCSTWLDKRHFNLNSIHSHAFVSDSLRITLKLRIGSRMIMRIIEMDEQSKPTSMDIFPSDSSVTTQVFENYLKLYSKHEALLLNSRSTILLEDGRQCITQISPEACEYALLNEKDMKNLVVRVQTELSPSDSLETLDDHSKEKLKISMRCMRNIIEDCEIALDLSLALRRLVDFRYDRENILICGGLGSGKTTICKMLIERYRMAPCFVHTRVIDCRSLKGKKLETIQKIIISVMNECVYYQPSILFMDDLESITNASLNDEENTIDATNASRITDMLLNIITQYQETHFISIVATCAGMNKIGSKLRPTRGVQFFKMVLSIPNLEKMDRIDILRLTLEDKLCVPGDINWNYYGNKTEGWMPQDLVDLAEKARFVAWKRYAVEKLELPIVMTETDINIALENCMPLSMQGVQLYKSGGYSWRDIGGLADTKSSLTEILQWPLKYPEIFKKAPIKLQSGVLLYGMPGTGKTMLAKAIAGECGVNLISIKGPELLSKYIGVSEESVRNVFERACRAKPCVLFFDEFDSLAPRRGHDSTGVTDRVVNQLLTQLDGVEDREGVAVVAASSRPDLLDPALLRPGRLDKFLHCPLPSQTEREEIFAVVCDAQNIDEIKLNLKELAQLSDGFTGADINASITQARLSAYEDAVAIATKGKIDAADIKVTQRHLTESVRSTRPSLSVAEKLKYTRIYARFIKEDTFTSDMLKNQKATLA